jgi:Tfp pilus assembly protein PilF
MTSFNLPAAAAWLLLLSPAFLTRLPAQTISEPCGSDILHRKALHDPAFQKKHEAFEQGIFQQIKSAQPDGAVVTLPVVVHIVHQNGPENISDAQVLQGIQQLNDAFANTAYYDQGSGVNTMIQFCLAKRTPDNLGHQRHYPGCE